MNSLFLNRLGFGEKRNLTVHCTCFLWVFFSPVPFSLVWYVLVSLECNISIFPYWKEEQQWKSVPVSEVFTVASSVCYREPSRTHVDLSRPFHAVLKCSKDNLISQPEVFPKVVNDRRRNLLELSTAGVRVGNPLHESTGPCKCSILLWDAQGASLHQCDDAGRVGSQRRVQTSSHSFVLYKCSVFPNSSSALWFCYKDIQKGCFKKGLFGKALPMVSGLSRQPRLILIQTCPPG